MVFEIIKGTAVTCAFGTEAQVKEWKPMLLPRSRDIEEVVASMEGEKFGVNKEFF